VPNMNERVALITGASSGIGRATAEAFAAKGARVVLAARRQDELASLVTEIEARGGIATAIKTDVSSAQDVERMVTHAIEVFGRLDYAVNNAGIEGHWAGITELAPQGIRVNIVCPGFIDTPMHRRARGIIGDEAYDKGVLPSVHLQRAGRPEEIARSIVFLCSDEASYITGTTLTPDGGFTLTV